MNKLQSNKEISINMLEDKNNFTFSEEIQEKIQSELLDYKMMKLLKYNKVDVLITGPSYFEVGLKEKYFDLDVFNVDLSGQDLHYDYLMLKYLLENYKVFNDLKYIVIGLSYYSFDYELIKTKSRLSTHRYVNYLKCGNEYYDINKLNTIHELYLNKYNYYEEKNRRKVQSIKTINHYIEGYKDYLINEAIKQAFINHEESQIKNIENLKAILEIAKLKNITPIIVVNPVSREYSSIIKQGNLINKFYSIINSISEEYDFKIYDYFDSDIFNNDDFFDYSHLNKSGAEKFSKLMNEEIMKLYKPNI